MSTDPWLPQGFSPADGLALQRCVAADDQWQLFESSTKGRVLVVPTTLAELWLADGLVTQEQIPNFHFGKDRFVYVLGGRGYRLEPVSGAATPNDFSECQAFVSAVASSRGTRTTADFHDAIYVERLSRLLPCYSPAPHTDDLTVTGFWVTGGVNVSLASARRLRALAPWLSNKQLESLVTSISPNHKVLASEASGTSLELEKAGAGSKTDEDLPFDDFRLPGRPVLEAFFNEHVIDLIRNEDRYKSLGIQFHGAILLHGPPGCGKTFAVEKLVEYLDWPYFSVDSGSIGSPYIHETGKKIAETFEQASKASPSVVVIDEIDAFLAARDSSTSGQHRVEEVAEFLRSIPKAAENRVLVIGMTNRLDSLDPAVVRRGRFDHIIDVGMPTEQEVHALLTAKLGEIPCADDIDIASLAERLAGRPLSDLGFIVREACRLSARSGLSKVGHKQIEDALTASPSRLAKEVSQRRIGFV